MAPHQPRCCEFGKLTGRDTDTRVFAASSLSIVLEGGMFHFDRGLFLTRNGLGVDVRRRQACGFISHAHADHMARHQLAICTPATARLYEHRLGPRPVKELPFRQPLDWHGLRLTTYPAGHILGSAMLLAEDDAGDSLLYSGDCKLTPSLTAEAAEAPSARILVIESTFGDPKYRMPPRRQIVEQLIELVQTILQRGETPIIHAYALGKAQEVTRILTDAGMAVLQHPKTYELSQIYERCGCSLGDCRPFDAKLLAGKVVVTLPRNQLGWRLPGIDRPVSISVTGWAMDASTRFRQGVDHAVPLSDHADYDQLFQMVEQVDPAIVYCTHGPVSFVDRLCEAGWNARPLDGARAV